MMQIFDINIPSELINSIMVVVVAIVAYLVIKLIIKKAIDININKSKQQIRRKKTLLSLIQRIIKYIIIFMAAMTILSIYHVDTTTIVTSVASVSLVVGLAFQDLLKDFLVGMAIIFENDFSVGDYIGVNGLKGEVINFTLKSTRIKSLTGEVYIISNREINTLTNYSLNKSLVRIDISTRYEEDLDKVTKVLKELCKELSSKLEETEEVVLEEGVEALGDSAVIFRISTLVSIKDIYVVKRKILKAVKKEFDKNGISIPYPQLEVHNE